MKLRTLLWSNLKRKKSRTVLCILGIVFSTMLIAFITLVANNYAYQARSFFVPFEGYDQIVEKGTNYFQFMPTGSSITENYTENITAFFNIIPIPCLLIPNDVSLTSTQTRFFFGIDLKYAPLLWEKVGLQSGEWADNNHEIVIGCNYREYFDKLIFNNYTFEIVGIFKQGFNILDNFILCDLENLQNLTNNKGFVSLFFVEKDIEQDQEKITLFEQKYSNLDLLTTQEMESIKGELFLFSERLALVYSTFAGITGLIFVFVLFMVNIISRKKDMAMLKLIGMANWQLIIAIYLEILVILCIGFISGFFFAILAYGGVMTYAQLSIGYSTEIWATFASNLGALWFYSPEIVLLRTFGFIIGGGLLLGWIPASLSLKVKPIQETKYNL